VEKYNRLIKNGIILYHGTTFDSLRKMFKNGYISNRNNLTKVSSLTNESLEVEAVTQYNAIYFSNDPEYCKNFAQNKANINHDSSIILQVNINKDTHKLLPDEDIIQYFWYGNKTHDLDAIANDIPIIEKLGNLSYRGNHRFVYKNELVDNNFRNYAYVITDDQRLNLIKWFQILLKHDIIKWNGYKYVFCKNIDVLKDKELNNIFNANFSYQESLKSISSLAIVGNIPVSTIKKINIGVNKGGNYIYNVFESI
jgi:hypothetical protein